MTTTEARSTVHSGEAPEPNVDWAEIAHPMGWTLACASCSEPPTGGPFHACATCGGMLEVRYDTSRIGDRSAWLRGQPHTIWGYAEMLPAVAGTITIGEGDTPLIPSQRLHRAFSRKVFWKNEGANPTLSHKDRFQSVAVSVARALGYTGIVGTSTGNHGIAGAAYATVGELKSLMFYPPEMSTAFLHLTSLYGGRAAVSAWERRAALLARVRERPGWCPVDGSNPFGLEGYKTIAYEIVRDLGHAPAIVLIPVGSGKLFTGIARGFRDLVALGLIDQLPRLVACQATGVDVLTRPFEEGKTSIPRREDISTIALSTKEPTADARVLNALRESEGAVVNVEEGAIMNAVRALGREGLAVEPASALSAAAVEALLAQGELDADADAVCILTASLTKTPELLPEAASARPWRLGTDTRELDRYLDAWEAADA